MQVNEEYNFNYIRDFGCHSFKKVNDNEMSCRYLYEYQQHKLVFTILKWNRFLLKTILKPGRF